MYPKEFHHGQHNLLEKYSSFHGLWYTGMMMA